MKVRKSEAGGYRANRKVPKKDRRPHYEISVEEYLRQKRKAA